MALEIEKRIKGKQILITVRHKDGGSLWNKNPNFPDASHAVFGKQGLTPEMEWLLCETLGCTSASLPPIKKVISEDKKLAELLGTLITVHTTMSAAIRSEREA